MGKAERALEFPGDFNRLLREISEKMGIDLMKYRDSYLKRRIGVRIKANQLGSYDEYLEFLRQNPQEYAKLLDRLTVNVSEFFRNPSTYEAFRKKVLPELKDKHDLRIWSAGCAAGEEPYSIAIVLSEFFGEELERRFVRIYATDIDEACIKKAMTGEYDKKRVENIETKILEKYFDRMGDVYRIKPAIKRMIVFERRDILKKKWTNFFDVVFCRNVAIYLSKEHLDVLYRNLYESLRVGGFLVTGKVESITGEVRGYFEIVDNREHIYRKVK